MMRGVSAPITYQREPVHGLWPELLPMMEAHYVELGEHHDIELNVDTGMYETVDGLGGLRCFTARDGADLVGYAVFFVREHAHHRDSVQASCDAVYLAPSYRCGLTGVDLLAHANRALRDEGVQVVRYGAKPDTPLSASLARLGYTLSEHTFSKRLDIEGPPHG